MTSSAIPPATLLPLLEPLLGAERPRRLGVLWLLVAPFVVLQLPLLDVSRNGWVHGVVSVLPAVVALLCYALGLAPRPPNRMQVALPAARARRS